MVPAGRGPALGPAQRAAGRPTPARSPVSRRQSAAGHEQMDVRMAVLCDDGPDPVRTFATFPNDRLPLRDGLRAGGVKTAATEFTSVDGIARADASKWGRPVV